MMKALSIILILMISLLGCSSDQTSKQRTFQAKGDYWSASINDTVIERNGKNYFQIHFTYTGNQNDLQEIERITFAQGTTIGTQLVNVYDPSYKEHLKLRGNYKEEYEETYGIKIEEIKERNSKEFIVDYNLMQDDSGYSTLDAIEKDRMNIQIEWESKDSNYIDKLNIRGS